MLETIFGAIETAINAIADFYTTANFISGIILASLGIWSFHLLTYRVIGFFTTRKFKPTSNLHKYAIVIAARNEEPVIGNLLDSIAHQDYPSELIDVFVVADNCTDNTAQIARSKGAVCYERFDPDHRTKGYALQFLFKNIEKDYGTDSYEAYFVFDADNLLNSDYITRMNEAFDSGEKIVTSYRNTKNFDENWIASTYAIHWLRSIRFRHRARSVLRLATNIQGTGFMFANELVKDGWNYTSLTEDRAFTADAVAQGYPISYCDAAMFYDEQPTSLRVALRQRLRWSKGHLIAFVQTGPALLKNIFVGSKRRKDTSDNSPITWKDFVEGMRCRWASFDTLAQLFPSVIVRVFLWFVVSLLICSCIVYTRGLEYRHIMLDVGTLSEMATSVINGSISAASLLVKLFNAAIHNISCLLFGEFTWQIAPGFGAMLAFIVISIFAFLLENIVGSIRLIFTAIYVFFMERKRIIKIPLYKKILYVFTWPVFDLIGKWTTCIALFMKIEWKPIPHTSTVTIHQIKKATEDAPHEKV